MRRLEPGPEPVAEHEPVRRSSRLLAVATKVLVVAVAGFFTWFAGAIIFDLTIGRSSVPERVVPVPDGTYLVKAESRPVQGDGYGPGRYFYLSSAELSEPEMTQRVVSALTAIGWELCVEGPASDPIWHSLRDLENEYSLQMWSHVSDGIGTTDVDAMVPAGQTVVWISVDGKPDRGTWIPGDQCVPLS